MSPHNQLAAVEAARLIRCGQLTSRELVDACIERIMLRDGIIRAWADYDRECAIAQAEACDQASELRGPLHGVPIGVKDVLDTADFRTGYGSRIYANNQTQVDAACVAALRAAGAVILGKTATAEFASITPPKTRNPVNIEHTPGGSSSGSAAAVADFMVPLAIGTQTGGSIIRPASFCGIVGFKPTYNLVDRAGLKFSAETLDTIGFMARSVMDVAAIFQSTVGDSKVSRQETCLSDIKIGLCMTDLWPDSASQAQAGVMNAIDKFGRAGVSVETVDLPDPYSQLLRIHETIIAYETARALRWEFQNYPHKLSSRLHARLSKGLAISSGEHGEALFRADEARVGCDGLLQDFDAIVTLSAKNSAPPGISHTGDATFNSVWTMLGVPCLHLPYGHSTNALPLGIQLIGRRYSDGRFLAVAERLEAALRVPARP